MSTLGVWFGSNGKLLTWTVPDRTGRKGFTLKELQALVEGQIELVPLRGDPQKRHAIVNETGLEKNLPLNEHANAFIERVTKKKSFLRGNVLIVKYNEEGDTSDDEYEAFVY